MTTLKPKFITFDCYGTLTRFAMADMTKVLFADRIAPGNIEQFVSDFAAYRLDEVLGEWQPYIDVIRVAMQRTCKRWGIEYQEQNLQDIYNAIPSWGPHADVPEPLALVAKHFPLVIYSNASDDQIDYNVAKLGAPFYKVFTAQQAQIYKPRLGAFEYMLENLGCGPEDVLHVSSSLRYDLMPANDMGICNKVFVNRGHEPSTPHYNYHEIRDLGGLPGLLGL
jgi:2-haloacid dehalogenase